MNPMIDLAMLKHHRVDYAPNADSEPRRTKPANPRSVALIFVVVMAVTFMTVMTGQA